jgi:hypothetical protein
MGARTLTLIATAAVGAALAVTTLPTRHAPPALGRLDAASLVRDGRPSERRLASTDVSWHGGPITASTGDHLTVYVSDSYPPDRNTPQQWADFFAGLIHGSELSLLTAYVATPDEVESLCNAAALGCYGGNELVVMGDPAGGEIPEEVARHEYGHHLAANRLNPPWRAVDWGTKRWASDENVCSRTLAGTAFPGNEDSDYQLNPGEAFAETYRAFVDARELGLAVSWGLVDRSFLPDANALQAVEQDVLHPWTAPTTTVARVRFKPHGRTAWTMPLATPLDGMLTVDLSFPSGTRYHESLADAASGKVLTQGLPSGRRTESLAFLVCGQRSLRLRVVRRGDPGRFTVHLVTP